jgi:hypothetical protein
MALKASEGYTEGLERQWFGRDLEAQCSYQHISLLKGG